MAEPGTQNIDASVARTAALSENAQRVLEATSANHSQEQSNRFQFGRQAREAVTSAPRPLKTLGTLSEKFGKQAASAEIPGKKIAEERDASMVSRSGDKTLGLKEDARASTIDTAGKVARRVIENGSLVGIDPAVLVDLRASMMELIPEIADVPLTDPGLIEAFADANIRDPEVLQAIVRRYKEIQSREIPEDIKPAQEAKAKADKALSEAEAAQKKLNGEKTRLAERQESLDVDNDDLNSDNQKLLGLRAKRPDVAKKRVDGDIERAEEKLAKVKAKRDSNPQDTNLEAEVRAAEAEANRLYGARDGYQAEISEIVKLEGERARLTRDIAKNAEQLSLANEALEAAKDTQRTVDVNLTDVRGRRVGFETEYANDYKNIVRDSIIEVNDKRVQEVNEAYRAGVIKDAENAGTQVDKAMAASVTARYSRTVGPGRVITGRNGGLKFFRVTRTSETVVDVNRAKDDVQFILLREGTNGPYQILRSELIKIHGRTNPIVDQLMANNEFADKWAMEFGQAALNTYLQNGGNLSEGQSRYISQRPLGMEIVNRAMQNKNVQAAENEMKQKNELPSGGFAEAVSTEKGKKHIALILKIAAGAMGPAAAAVVGSAAQTATGKGH